MTTLCRHPVASAAPAEARTLPATCAALETEPRFSLPQSGLAEWLASNEERTASAWKPIAARWVHFCHFVGSFVDEHSDLIVHCRCHAGQEFFAAQDRKAVEIDARR